MKNNKEELIAGFKRLRPLELIEIAQAMGFESVFHDIIISDYTWEIGFNAETNSFVAVCSELSCSTFGESMEELEQNIKLMIEHSQKVMEDGISYIGIKNLMKLPKEVVNASRNDGLPLIDVSNIKGRTAECVWVKGIKKLSDESGAIAWDYFKDDCVIFHGKTVQSAKIGLNKKIQILVEQEKNRQRRF